MCEYLYMSLKLNVQITQPFILFNSWIIEIGISDFECVYLYFFEVKNHFFIKKLIFINLDNFFKK